MFWGWGRVWRDDDLRWSFPHFLKRWWTEVIFPTCCAEVPTDCIFRVLWEALDGALFVEYSPLMWSSSSPSHSFLVREESSLRTSSSSYGGSARCSSDRKNFFSSFTNMEEKNFLCFFTPSTPTTDPPTTNPNRLKTLQNIPKLSQKKQKHP